MNHFFERAEKIFHDKTIVTASLAGVQRTTYGDWAVRTRRLGGVLDNLGIPAGARVGTFAWNSARHLEAWFAIPCSRRVLHTLNIRLFPDQLTYVVNHAEDEAIFVDRSLLPVHDTLATRGRYATYALCSISSGAVAARRDVQNGQAHHRDGRRRWRRHAAAAGA
jgi:acyl-CoA synthetase (AMP-forming)/AMP-acid ligase II